MSVSHLGSACGLVSLAVGVSMCMCMCMSTAEGVLCQGLALSLEQVVSRLGALELALHQRQRLARRKDGFSGLGGWGWC